MDKRTVMAVVLSVMVIIGYQAFFAPQPMAPKSEAPGPGYEQKAATGAPGTGAPGTGVPGTGVPDKAAPGTAAGEGASGRWATGAADVPAPVGAGALTGEPTGAGTFTEKLITVETDLYNATFSSRGGVVQSWTLKKYKDKEGEDVSLLRSGGPIGALALGWAGDYSALLQDFKVTGDSLKLSYSRPTGTLVFESSGANYNIRRTYTFHNDNYSVDIRDEVKGPPVYQITLGGNFGIFDKKGAYMHVGPAVLEGTDRTDLTVKKFKKGPKSFTQGVKWIAIEDKYFVSALVPGETIKTARAWNQDGTAAIALEGAAGVNELLLYAGPKEEDALKAAVPKEEGALRTAGSALEHIIDFGFFSIIARPIFRLLKFCYSLVGNYGWAIIMMTLIVRIPFIPIVHRGQTSMKRLQKVQPLMQEIRTKYKKDPQRMQQEMMSLYKKHKVNPMGGCLPMLLQIPVFIALYKVLLIAIELRGAPFILWITDLSMKDPYYVFPIVMGASMFLQQKMSPPAGDPKQQKIMMLMPVVFTFMFLNFASGLVVYWLVNNILSISQQLYINRKAK